MGRCSLHRDSSRDLWIAPPRNILLLLRVHGRSFSLHSVALLIDCQARLAAVLVRTSPFPFRWPRDFRTSSGGHGALGALTKRCPEFLVWIKYEVRYGMALVSQLNQTASESRRFMSKAAHT